MKQRPRTSNPQTCWVCGSQIPFWTGQRLSNGQMVCSAHRIGLRGFSMRGLTSLKYNWAARPGHKAYETWAKLGVTHKSAQRKRKKKQSRDRRYVNR